MICYFFLSYFILHKKVISKYQKEHIIFVLVFGQGAAEFIGGFPEVPLEIDVGFGGRFGHRLNLHCFKEFNGIVTVLLYYLFVGFESLFYA